MTDAASLSGQATLKEKPITKIVNLLKDMQAQLDAEGKEDQEMYDKLTCWCETNDKEKTKAIADGQQKVVTLTATIEEAVATSSTLSTEIQTLQAEAEKSMKALGEAEEIRNKEANEFAAEEKDATATIESLTGAVTALGKANPSASFVQREALLQVSQALRRRPAEAIAAARPHDRTMLRQLLTAVSPDKGISLLQTSYGLRATAPASGAIFGMLGQMKESFEENLANSKAEEARASTEFASLRDAKTTENAATTNKILTDKEEVAKADSLKTQSEDDKKNTEGQIAADTTFLENLRKQCANIDVEFQERTKARLEEVTAVGDTIGILTSDEAQSSFSKSTSLFQARAQSKSESKARAATAAYLAKAAKRLGSPRLAFLGVRVEADGFGKIKENIDKMVGQLSKDGKDEEVHKNDCVSDIKDNGKQTASSEKHKTDVETEINVLEADIAALTEEKKKLSEQIFDAQIELKRAGENREAENKDFQVTVQDQRATAEIVKKALDRMAEVYGKKVLLQLGVRQTPPGSFKAAKKNGGGTGVMYLLEGVIKDAEEVEADATEAENKAQQAYEQFAKDTNTMIAESTRQITNINQVLGKDEETEIADEGDKRHTEKEIRGLEGVADTLHDNCDWDIEHFSERQDAREAEQEAMKEAKAIFSGMSGLQEGSQEFERIQLQGGANTDNDSQ